MGPAPFSCPAPDAHVPAPLRQVRPRQGAGVFVTATEPAEDWPTRLRRAAVTDVYEVRMAVEVHAARLAARRRTAQDVTAMERALRGRRTASAGGDAAFVDADIAFHAALVAAAHNPVLTDLFTEFTLVLREGLIDLPALTGVRAHDPNTGDEAHEALVRAVAEGAAEVLRGSRKTPSAARTLPFGTAPAPPRTPA
ncbi:FCD domain-containing protein [Streptomyces sp. NPDC001617]